jgi:hypothetical protein
MAPRLIRTESGAFTRRRSIARPAASARTSVPSTPKRNAVATRLISRLERQAHRPRPSTTAKRSDTGYTHRRGVVPSARRCVREAAIPALPASSLTQPESRKPRSIGSRIEHSPELLGSRWAWASQWARRDYVCSGLRSVELTGGRVPAITSLDNISAEPRLFRATSASVKHGNGRRLDD